MRKERAAAGGMDRWVCVSGIRCPYRGQLLVPHLWIRLTPHIAVGVYQFGNCLGCLFCHLLPR